MDSRLEQGSVRIWTVGHSTRNIEEFLNILAAHRVKILIDVRSFPASRRYPQFNQAALSKSLAEARIDYLWMKELGGRRRSRPDSRNTRWRNVSFRAYADYMETDAFQLAIAQLQDAARLKRAAMMCAEAVWWRCHRSLISDHLKSIGVEVIHIADALHGAPHTYTEPAQIVNGRLSYSAGDSLPF